MNQKQFEEIVTRHQVKPKHARHLLVAFVTGGGVGVFAHGCYLLGTEVLKLSNEDAGMVSTLTVILVTVILTICGVYKKWAKRTGAGLFIPTSGFANSVASSAIESRFEGPIYGVGSRMFYLAGSVITYGFVAAFTYGCLRLLLSLVGVPL